MGASLHGQAAHIWRLHVFCAEGWEELVPLQIERLKQSGLAARTKTLLVSCIYRRADDVEKLRKMLEGISHEMVACTPDASQYEYPALDAAYAKAREEDCLIYYFHTKGVSYHGPQRATAIGSISRRRWRRGVR